MRKLKRRRRKPRGLWGVVEVRSMDGFDDDGPVWLAYWIELRAPRRVAIEIDPDRGANISRAAWRRARRAFGPPLAIHVLDDDTAMRVRRVVPSRVRVVVTPDDPYLRAMATIGDQVPDDVQLLFPRMLF